MVLFLFETFIVRTRTSCEYNTNSLRAQLLNLSSTTTDWKARSANFFLVYHFCPRKFMSLYFVQTCECFVVVFANNRRNVDKWHVKQTSNIVRFQYGTQIFGCAVCRARWRQVQKNIRWTKTVETRVGFLPRNRAKKSPPKTVVTYIETRTIGFTLVLRW